MRTFLDGLKLEGGEGIVELLDVALLRSAIIHIRKELRYASLL